MSKNIFMDTAKIMSKGQVTIPKDVRTVLGVSMVIVSLSSLKATTSALSILRFMLCRHFKMN